MRDWSLSCGTTATEPADPISLTLAADMRLCQPDYLNDHIWELEIGAGEPASVAVRTTYGLRARNMRLFYRFGEEGASVTNPATFVRGPRVRRFYPNYLWLDFVPIQGLEVSAEYWVPESHALAGRVVLANRTNTTRKVDFELCGALTPLDGKSLSFSQQHMVNVLSGRTGGLIPLLFMAGGPSLGPGPHPSLALKVVLEAGASRTIAWCAAAEANLEASFELARKVAARPWDAERTRIELMDAGDTVDIHTGDPDWDAALALSQKAALASFFSGSEHLPNPSFVSPRQPDEGYSHSATGIDHAAGWSGQSPFDAYYVSSLLPMARRLRLGLIENFLSAQGANGTIDGKLGLAGQRARFLAAPLLATLAWQYYEDSQDLDFLQEAFPKLFGFFEQWFSPEQDPDRDGIPEWSHILQTGFEDHPLFDTWHPWSQGVPIGALFNPELEALLYREAESLIRMAEKLERDAEVGKLHEIAAILRESVEAAWSQLDRLYSYRDRLTHVCSTEKLITKHRGSGEMRPRKAQFHHPVRLLIEIQTEEPRLRRPVIEVSGLGEELATAEGDPRQRERFEDGSFQWRAGGLTAVSQRSYCKINRISVSGLKEEDKLVVRTIDATGEDVTLFTPLWAHIPEPARAESMVRGALLDEGRFGRPFGVPALAAAPDVRAELIAASVHLPWNQMIGEGLLSYGYREEAARLTEKLMAAVIRCLKQSRGFYERYHADNGSGIGERGAVAGLAPVGLFLKVLGLQILSPTSVRLEGKNPFAWPVKILYKGLSVNRGLEETEVTFANGQVVKVSGAKTCVISL